MAASSYVIITTLFPGLQMTVDRAEFERLSELDVIDELVAVTETADRVVITDGEIPSPTPAEGTVWFDRSQPFIF